MHLAAFGTPRSLYEWLRLPQGVTGAPSWIVSVMRFLIAGFDNIQMYVDDAIGSGDCPINHVAIIVTFLHD